MNEWTNWMKQNEWTNKWMNQWTNEMNEYVNEYWINEINQSVNERMKSTNGWMLSVNGWLNERIVQALPLHDVVSNKWTVFCEVK